MLLQHPFWKNHRASGQPPGLNLCHASPGCFETSTGTTGGKTKPSLKRRLCEFFSPPKNGCLGLMTTFLFGMAGWLGRMFQGRKKNVCEFQGVFLFSEISLKRRGATNLKIMTSKWMFPKIGVPQNGWFIMENPIKMG